MGNRYEMIVLKTLGLAQKGKLRLPPLKLPESIRFRLSYSPTAG